jgi:hypothetical protein
MTSRGGGGGKVYKDSGDRLELDRGLQWLSSPSLKVNDGGKGAGLGWYGMGETIFKPELEKAREHNMIL